jgi:phosphotransferase system HPr (HPr) family protein
MFERTVHLPADADLHARPARDVVKAAVAFASSIRLVFGGREVDAKSILQVMGLGATRGSAVVVRAEGPDADGAVNTIGNLLLAIT